MAVSGLAPVAATLPQEGRATKMRPYPCGQFQRSGSTRLTVRTFKNLTELVGLAGLGDCLSVADTSPSVLSEISGSKTLALGETAPTASFSPSATLLLGRRVATSAGQSPPPGAREPTEPEIFTRSRAKAAVMSLPGLLHSGVV